jgi:hypothetical protein
MSVPGPPFGFAIDSRGMIRSIGLLNGVDDVKKLADAHRESSGAPRCPDLGLTTNPTRGSCVTRSRSREAIVRGADSKLRHAKITWRRYVATRQRRRSCGNGREASAGLRFWPIEMGWADARGSSALSGPVV